MPNPASLLAIRFLSQAADIPCGKQQSARAPVPELAYTKGHFGLQGPKIALVFLSLLPGTADMRRMEPTSTCHRPGCGCPSISVPASARGQQEGITSKAWELGRWWHGGKSVLFWLWFYSSTPPLTWKQLCGLDQPPENCQWGQNELCLSGLQPLC